MNDDDLPPAELSDDAPDRGTARSRRRRTKLTEAQKDYVIRRLAAYDTPTEIARDLEDRFGIEVSRQSIEQYDPTRVEDCSRQSADLFFQVREDLRGDRADVPVNRTRAEERRRERLMLRAVEILANRIVESIDAGGRDIFAKRADRISDSDRLRALIDFVDRLKTANPPGYAALRKALAEEPMQQPADATPCASAAEEDEERHAD